MPFREKMNLAVPGEISGRACFSALKAYWRGISFKNQTKTQEDQASLAQDFDKQKCSAELHGLVDTLSALRHRILTTTLLRGWTKWFVWVLIGLIAVALASPRLGGALVFVIVLAAIGAAAILAWTWRTRFSTYEAARRLDSTAGLKDRISTAIYLGDIEDPDEMIGQQRKDALVRLAKVDLRGLFPVRLPANAGRAFVLVLVVAGLFAYRIHHKPPLVSLLRTTARSQLVQSILSPFVHAMEKDLQRTIALVTMKPDAMGDEVRPGDSGSFSDNFWKASDEKEADANEEQQDSAQAGAGDLPQDQLQPPGNQEASPSGEARQEENNAQSQEGKNGSESTASNSQRQSEPQGAESRQSLGQSLMQALKNILSNSSNQANDRADQRLPNNQGAPQSGNARQPGTTEGDRKSDSRGSSDAKQKPSKSASEGAGSQPGSKELRKDQETHPINAIPDRIALEASGFKDQTRMKAATETGTAQLASRDLSPQGGAVINGAEQENIPARYRFYVQRYFEHADNGKH